MLFQREEKEVIQRYVTEFYNLKPVYSNYYPFDLSEAEFIRTEHSLILRKADNDFYRLYILSIDKVDLLSVLSEVGVGYAVNIPSKKEIPLWDEILREVGFRLAGVYKRYYNRHISKWGDFEENYAYEGDLETIYDILYEYFDPIMDRLPSRDVMRRMILDRQVLVNRSEGKVCGVFIFTLEGRKCYFNAWRDKSGNGIKLLLDAYNMMYERGVGYAYFWIKKENVFVEKIHKKLGAEFDGLMDYTYLK